MADAFSVASNSTYISVTENPDTGHVTIEFNEPGETHTITVDGGDLARAFITASPTFAAGVSEVAQRAILQFVGRE